MEEKYKFFRIEFNEKKQHFHHAYSFQNQEPYTNGYYTIAEYCTNEEWRVFEAFVNRVKKKRLSLEYVLKSFEELQGFYKNLLEYRMIIGKSKDFKIDSEEQYIYFPKD